MCSSRHKSECTLPTDVLYPTSKQGMEQILHVVFLGESQLLGSFTSIGQRVHATTQTLNNCPLHAFLLVCHAFFITFVRIEGPLREQ